jgi:hypothetical protein
VRLFSPLPATPTCSVGSFCYLDQGLCDMGVCKSDNINKSCIQRSPVYRGYDYA